MSTNGVNAVERALTIVESFRGGGERRSLTEIAERTGLNKATIIRLIASLEKFGYVHRTRPGEYALGPAFLEFSDLYQASFRLADHALPIMRDLAQETGESAGLFVRDGDKRICLHKVMATAPLVSGLREGDRLPILPGGTGKIFLAFSADPAEREDWQDIRNAYLSVNFGERHAEIASIAAPVFERSDRLAAVISVSGPAASYTAANVAASSRAVLSAAANLTSRLGGNAEPLRARARDAAA
jgi:DNA-binding IclR family transcriptional regulator